MSAPQAESVALALTGVFVPVTSPFDPVTGDLDVIALRANLRRILAAPVQGLVVAGTTGEAALLAPDERKAAIRAAAELVGDGRLVIAGTGAESTRETVRLSVEAAEAGADAVLVQPPAYYRSEMSDHLLELHYRAVADASPLPVVLYQAPLACSTLELSTPLVAQLSRHPGIVGIKDSRGKLPALGEHLDAVADGFRVLVGNGAQLYGALEMGADGGILGVANLVPAETAEMSPAPRGGPPQGGREDPGADRAAPQGGRGRPGRPGRQGRARSRRGVGGDAPPAPGARRLPLGREDTRTPPEGGCAHGLAPETGPAAPRRASRCPRPPARPSAKSTPYGFDGGYCYPRMSHGWLWATRQEGALRGLATRGPSASA